MPSSTEISQEQSDEEGYLSGKLGDVRTPGKKNHDNFKYGKLGFDFNQFQAILPIPFFHVGTDNFDAKVHGRIQQKSLSLAMETGLPLMASMGNRSSVSRAYNLFQVTTESYEQPAILKDFNNNNLVGKSEELKVFIFEEGKG